MKYGFGRATDHVGIDIRNGRMTREEGKILVEKFDGKYPWESIRAFSVYSGLTIDQIDEVINDYTNPMLFKTDGDGNFLRDTNKNLILVNPRS